MMGVIDTFWFGIACKSYNSGTTENKPVSGIVKPGMANERARLLEFIVTIQTFGSGERITLEGPHT